MRTVSLFICFSFSIGTFELIAQSDSVKTFGSFFHLKWTTEGHRHSSNPLVQNGLVHETFGIRYAINASSGEKVFFGNVADQSFIRQYSVDSILYFSMRRGGNAIVNIYTGEIIFQSKESSDRPWIKRPRVSTDTIVYHAVNDSIFSATSVRDGRSIWRKKMNGIYDVPVVVQNSVYVFDDDFVFTFNRITGKELYRMSLGRLGADPIVEDGLLYAFVIDKGLLCYKLATKELVWQYTDFDGFHANYQLVNQKETLFIIDKHLKAISKGNGSLEWENTELGAGDTHLLAATQRHILTYKTYDDQVSLAACEMNTGQTIYERFSENGDRTGDNPSVSPLENLDGMVFRFGQRMYGNLLYAVDVRGWIYCFEVIE